MALWTARSLTPLLGCVVNFLVLVEETTLSEAVIPHGTLFFPTKVGSFERVNILKTQQCTGLQVFMK